MLGDGVERPPYGFGGGVHAEELILSDSTVSNNVVGQAGGGLFVTKSGLVERSTISGNTAVYNGGGIDLGFKSNNATLRIDESTIVLNEGGGLFVRTSDADVVINSSIIASNRPTTTWSDMRDTGDLYATSSHDGASSATPRFTLSHSLIGNYIETQLSEAQFPDAAGNLIGSVLGLGAIDPLLGPLADNGGPTSTHALLEGSPAIDSGGVALSSQFDQRGFPFNRPMGMADMGSFELQTGCDVPSVLSDVDRCLLSAEAADEVLKELGLLPGDLNGDGFIDFSDFLRLSANLGRMTSTYTDGDIDRDGVIGLDDFLILLGNFGKSGQSKRMGGHDPSALD